MALVGAAQQVAHLFGEVVAGVGRAGRLVGRGGHVDRGPMDGVSEYTDEDLPAAMLSPP
ncbi:hypothetical protein ACTMU2_25150 [Cupriavidus basilensis]